MFFLAVPAFAGDPDKTVSVGESVSLSAKATDSDCDYTRNPRGEEKTDKKITITWSAVWKNPPHNTAGTFKDGDNEGSSVIWIAPNSGGEVVITSTADNSQSSKYPDGSVSDSIIVLVVSVDLDIWNGLTSGIGDPVPDIGRLLLYLKIFVFPLDIRGSNINNDHNKQEIANGIDNNNDVSMLHV